MADRDLFIIYSKAGRTPEEYTGELEGDLQTENGGFAVREKKTGKGRLGDTRKKLVIGALGLVSAAALTVGSLFASPADLMAGEPLPIVELAAQDDGDGDASYVFDDGERQRRGRSFWSRVAAFFSGLPDTAKALLLMPLWLLGRGLLLLGGTAAALLRQPLVSLLLNLALLVGVGLLCFKLLHPEKRLGEFFSKRRVILLVCGAVALSAADFILPELLEDYETVKKLAILAVSLLVPAGVYFACRRARSRLTAAAR